MGDFLKKLREDCAFAVFCQASMAIIFLRWLHSLATSLKEGPVPFHIFDEMLGSKLKTCWITKGHSKPHLQVPSVCRYVTTSCIEARLYSLGLIRKLNIRNNQFKNKILTIYLIYIIFPP